MGAGGGQSLVKQGLICCTSTDPAAVELVWCSCTHCCCPVEEASRWIYLLRAQEKSKSSIQSLPFLLLFWVVCDIFSFLSQPVVWPNPSVPVSGPQDLLGALNKARPSHGVYGRGTGERQGLHGEEWHQCQWGSFSAISELGMVGNARLMLASTDVDTKQRLTRQEGADKGAQTDVNRAINLRDISSCASAKSM